MKSDFNISYSRFLYSPLRNMNGSGINDTLLLFYSPHLDRRINTKKDTKNLADISTGNLIRMGEKENELFHRYPDADYMQIKDTFRQLLFFSNFKEEFLPSGITIPEYLEVNMYWYEDFSTKSSDLKENEDLFESELKSVMHPIGYGTKGDVVSELSLYNELVSLYRDGNIKCKLQKLRGIKKWRDFKFYIKRTSINNKIITALVKYYFQQGFTNATFTAIEGCSGVINNNCIIKWEGLSSGELAFYNILSRIFSALTSMHSEIFHYQEYKVNLVKDSKYKSILLLLDEPEISFHPEWQKRFLKILINALNKTFKEFKFQVILASHSPILVSDFPKDNIVFLNKTEKGNCVVVDSINVKNTFGANIYSLYKDNFFLDGLPIGDFAKSRIEKLFDILRNKEEIQRGYILIIKKEIEMIGEPILKGQLMKLYHEKCDIEERIYSLEKEVEGLKKQRDND